MGRVFIKDLAVNDVFAKKDELIGRTSFKVTSKDDCFISYKERGFNDIHKMRIDSKKQVYFLRHIKGVDEYDNTNSPKLF
jgi:hypothetical protein